MRADVFYYSSILWKRIQTYGQMIRFSHTIFALPFALSAVVLAQRESTLTLSRLFWILMAMVGARSSAMGINRIADTNFDEKNPRTAGREIPAKKISVSATIIFIIFFSGLFIFSSAMLGSLCLYLSIPVLLILFFYSYTKRFTWLCHFYLGAAISIAPAGAWIAVADGFSWPVIVLSIALFTYITGFDILYSCQDLNFDKKQQLCSIPVRFGVKKALIISSVIHMVSFLAFLGIYFIFNMGRIYLVAVFMIGIFLFIEQRLVKPKDLNHIHIAFFHMNSLISITLFMGIFIDEMF
jgi:4-hydroxybenzoate polyprenyltransferase